MSEDQNRARLERELFVDRDSPELKQRQRVQSRRFTRDFKALELRGGLTHVRKRPAMYLGDVYGPGKILAITEIASNSVDQFLAKKASYVSLKVEDDWIDIQDDGEGFPINVYCGDRPLSFGEDLLTHVNLASELNLLGRGEVIDRSNSWRTFGEEESFSLGEHYLTHRHSTATADHHAPHVHFSTWNGLGVAAINALCEHFVVQAWRGRELWEQRFSRGIPLCDPFLVKKGDGRGTHWRFQLDKELFEDDPIPISTLHLLFKGAACLYPGLKLIVQGRSYLSKEGLIDLCKQHSISKVRKEDQWSYQCVKDQVRIDVAAFGRAKTTYFRAYANGMHCGDGGSHLRGLIQALRTVDWTPEIAIINVLFENPEFAGPNKTKLGTVFIQDLVRDALAAPLKAHFS
ncbi:MAG: hypothetical protein P1V97_04955 [Planctomycetota bacterium]|nr:hypothetical protein [Planctomycetota bacterium]